MARPGPASGRRCQPAKVAPRVQVKEHAFVKAYEPWHLRREINISLIFGFISQVVVAIWWISDFNAWRHETEDHLGRVDKSLDGTAQHADAMDRELTDRLGRIETMLADIEKRMDGRTLH